MSDEEGVTMSKVRPIALAVAQKLVFRGRIRDSVARRRAAVARLVLAFAALLGMTMLPLAVATAAGDTTPPTLSSFSFSPTTVDTSASAQSISVTAHVSDDIAGVEYGAFSFVGPSNQHLSGYFDASDRTSGTALDGTYQINVSVPRSTAEGTWTVGYFETRDQAGNYRQLRTADLSAAGFQTSFTQTGAGDTTPPTLSSFSFSPTTVDTSASAQSISVTAHVSDDIAGVEYGAFSFVGPSNQHLSGYFDASDRTSGTALDGTYQINVSVPRSTAEGTWTVGYFETRDQAGNYRQLRTADLSAAGFQTSFTQTGAGDTTPPTLSSFSFSPTTVDTSASAQSISVTAHVSDDIAGVEYGAFSFVGPSNQHLSGYFDASDRTSGTALDGTYQINVSVPRSTAEGTWTVGYFETRDQAGNYRQLRTADLSAAGFQTSLTVGVSGGGEGGGGGGAPPSSSDPNSTNNTAPVPSSMGVSQHERSVTLKLKGSLRASGDVSVSDGFAACASSVPVKLQRKVSDSWKTVKSVTTSATGSYRAELADRSGTYRALVSTTAMPSGDTCAKAISQQRLVT